MNFTKFAVSAIDEEQESRVTLKGGLITYVNNRIQEQTKVIKSCTEYLVTQTGNLVLINCYLPQQGRFYTDGRYVTAVDEIIEVVDTLGPEMTYIIAGDFNSNGPNLPHFHRLKEELSLSDLSAHIDHTYEFKSKEGVIKGSKIDHFLARSLPESSVMHCEKTSSYFSKGGHSVLELYAKLPEIETAIDEEFEASEERPVYIDFDKITPSQQAFFDETAIATIGKFSLKPMKRPIH